MIINTSRFISFSPRQYIRPSSVVSSLVVVVGSGPSLDYSIDFIRQLSLTHTIVCGGSNYRTLLSHGITPDFLVLVERADEVYTSYKSIYDEFGRTSTKLVVSSTCY